MNEQNKEPIEESEKEANKEPIEESGKKTNKEQKKKPKKKAYIDDGHTIYDMSAFTGKDKESRTEHVGLSTKEKIAAILAAFECYLPLLFIVLGSFVLVMLLIKLWLRV